MRKLARDTSALWLPKHWPYWVAFIIAWLVVQLPYRWLMRIGKFFGGMSYYFPSYSKKILFANLNLCFPELSNEEKKSLAHKNFQSAGMTMLEVLLAWFASDRKICHLLKVHNPQRLSQHEEGRLAILPHFHTLSIVARIYSLNVVEGGRMTSTVFRPHRKAVINKFNEGFYKKVFNKAIPSTSMKAMVRSLREKDILLFLPDIDPGKKLGIFSIFFGVQARTVSGVGKLASLGKAKVMPMYFLRRDDLSGYDLHPCELLDNYPSGDEQADTDSMNACFEKIIRKHPEQYLWQYKRFTRRPEGEKPRYPSKKRDIRKHRRRQRAAR
jgi:Kdo2-lipid IVA lauroyltransferase/acyltransferase